MAFILLSMILGRIKVFEIESSGMVFSIKSYRPYCIRRVLPSIEFPLRSLQYFSLNGDLLLISLQRANGKASKLRIRLYLFKSKDFDALKNHLEQHVKNHFS